MSEIVRNGDYGQSLTKFNETNSLKELLWIRINTFKAVENQKTETSMKSNFLKSICMAKVFDKSNEFSS